jgi:hypothetical protein
MATKWQRSHRAKPLLDDVLANVTPGRSHRLHLSAEQKRALSDRDGRLARQALCALLRARERAVAPRPPRDEFPLTEDALQAIAHKLGLADSRAERRTVCVDTRANRNDSPVHCTGLPPEQVCHRNPGLRPSRLAGVR